MRNLILILAMGLAACGDNGAGMDADAGVTPSVSCEAVHAAYGRLETQCGRAHDSLYLAVDGPDCATVTETTRPEDVAVCVAWLDWPPGRCGELHGPGDPPWTPTANCLDLFR
jgi:hypothetical protein